MGKKKTHKTYPYGVDETSYRCPVSQCNGWARWDPDEEDAPCWSCGYCGSIWYEKKNLLQEVGEMAARYPYRKKCYRKVKGAWAPAPLADEPDDYPALVDKEPVEPTDGEFVRG